MKKIVVLIIAFSVFFLMSQGSLLAQVTDPGKKTEKEAEKRANKNIDKGINKAFDDLEKGIGSLFKKNKKKNTSPQPEAKQSEQVAGQSKDIPVAAQEEPENEKPSLNWAKYDFVPGDKIIFEDNLSGEENGEFPSRWDFVSGNIEIAEFGGENVIMFRSRESRIVPYMKEPGKDYLPDVFTVEFDLYCGESPFSVYLYDIKNQKSGSPSGYTDINIYNMQMTFSYAKSSLPNNKSLKKRRWIHVAIAYTNGKLKSYIDETRLINLPRIDFEPKGISLSVYHAYNEYLYYVKNFRIAEGGVKYYDRFLQDGKIVSNGIRFDVGKATLRPESMGVLNKIYKLLSEHPEVNFSIEGHTDADGDFDFNQKLSEERAKTVMNQLASMGIDSDRLSSKGFGESKPINTNDTPEGKAANRRVEFVKN